jgi:hypothetical protein
MINYQEYTATMLLQFYDKKKNKNKTQNKKKSRGV